MLVFLLLVAMVFTTFANAQNAKVSISQSMLPRATARFFQDRVSSTDAYNWAHTQLETCIHLCNGTVSTNTASQIALTWRCLCANGIEPDCSAFIQTMPYFICHATYIQCMEDYPGDEKALQRCKDNAQCGTKNATAIEAAASSTVVAMPTASKQPGVKRGRAPVPTKSQRAADIAVVHNACPVEIYYRVSWPSHEGRTLAIAPGASVEFPFADHPYRGVSVKLSEVNDPTGRAAHVQFEFNFKPSISRVWWDLSNINGHPFTEQGFKVTPQEDGIGDGNCRQAHCPAKVRYCHQAYNNPSDWRPMRDCHQSTKLTMTVCSG